MINYEKHTIQFGTGDVDIKVIETNEGKPVLLMYNNMEKVSPSNSVLMTFASPVSIDGMISLLQNMKRTYFVSSSLGSTQSFNLNAVDTK